MFKKILFLGALTTAFSAYAQDMNYTSQVLDKLTSADFAGRGYVEDGHLKAATYIAAEFEKVGLKKFEKTYFQTFELPVNMFPGAMEVMIEKDIFLKPGKDYLVSANSPSLKGGFDLVYIDSTVVADKKKLKKMSQMDYSAEFLVIDDANVKEQFQKDFLMERLAMPWGAKGVIYLTDTKLTWSASSTQSGFVRIDMPRSVFNKLKHTKIFVNIEAQLKKVKTQNVIGYVPGTSKPDSFIVVSAHYDHLGKMGAATYFPGASDNASGTSMLLNLAQYYVNNTAKYSVVFIAFAAEEVEMAEPPYGLAGSAYYVEHPLFSLKKIRFQLNIDIIGDATDGITVVNGTILQSEYSAMMAINDAKKYVPNIQKRGETKNSDHYPFYAKGVKSFFIYSRGKITAYHDVTDTKEGLPLTNYQGCFQLFKDFIAAL